MDSLTGLQRAPGRTPSLDVSLPIDKVFVGDEAVPAVLAGAVATIKPRLGLQLADQAFGAGAIRANNHGFSSQMIFM